MQSGGPSTSGTVQGGPGTSGAADGAAGASGQSASGGGSTTGVGAPLDATSATGDAHTELDAGRTGGPVDADPSPTDAARSNKILIYGVTSPGSYRHASIPTAAAAMARAASGVGLTPEIVGASDPTNIVDPTKFTAASLAQYGAAILLSTAGEPFGYPATQRSRTSSTSCNAGARYWSSTARPILTAGRSAAL